MKNQGKRLALGVALGEDIEYHLQTHFKLKFLDQNPLTIPN